MQMHMQVYTRDMYLDLCVKLLQFIRTKAVDAMEKSQDKDLQRQVVDLYGTVLKRLYAEGESRLHEEVGTGGLCGESSGSTLALAFL